MIPTNREWVGRAMDSLADGLRLFVSETFRERYGGQAEAERKLRQLLDRLASPRVRELQAVADGPSRQVPTVPYVHFGLIEPEMCPFDCDAP